MSKSQSLECVPGDAEIRREDYPLEHTIATYMPNTETADAYTFEIIAMERRTLIVIPPNAPQWEVPLSHRDLVITIRNHSMVRIGFDYWLGQLRHDDPHAEIDDHHAAAMFLFLRHVDLVQRLRSHRFADHNPAFHSEVKREIDHTTEHCGVFFKETRIHELAKMFGITNDETMHTLRLADFDPASVKSHTSKVNKLRACSALREYLNDPELRSRAVVDSMGS